MKWMENCREVFQREGAHERGEVFQLIMNMMTHFDLPEIP